MISSLTHSLRLLRAGYVLAREGVFGLVDPSPLPPSARFPIKFARLFERPHVAGRNRLPAALTALGPTYVKLGQFLATRQDVVGLALSRDLETLQDRMAPFPQVDAESTVARALEKPVGALFKSFGPAVAAASIAQVHKAETTDGRTVAVKVLRPGVEQRLRSELQSFYFAARKAEEKSPEARRLRLIEVVDTLARSVTVEMDLRLEAAALSEMAENTKDDADFRVPSVDWNFTAKDVLTLEWIDGTPLTDRAALAAKGYDLPDLGRIVIQSFLRHAMRDGFFHADMHPGNLFVDHGGKLVAVHPHHGKWIVGIIDRGGQQRIGALADQAGVRPVQQDHRTRRIRLGEEAVDLFAAKRRHVRALYAGVEIRREAGRDILRDFLCGAVFRIAQTALLGKPLFFARRVE